MCALDHPVPVQFSSEKQQPLGFPMPPLGASHKAHEALCEHGALPEPVPWISLSSLSFPESDQPTFVAPRLGFQFVNYLSQQWLLCMFLRAQHGAHVVTQREGRTVVSRRPRGTGGGGNPARPWGCSQNRVLAGGKLPLHFQKQVWSEILPAAVGSRPRVYMRCLQAMSK